jgi:hypothetical protein
MALLRQALPDLTSSWAFNLEVSAESINDAYAEAEAYLSAVLAALDLLGDGPPYRAMLTSVTTPTGEATATANIVHQKVYEPQDLLDDEARRATDWADAAQADRKGRAAARLLAEGVTLWDASVGSRPIQAASLLAFFRAIELVVQDFSAPDIDAQERSDWEKQWEARLSSVEGSELAEVVREASRALDSLEGVTLSTRIERAGRAWGLSEETIQSAQAFRRFRHQKLAHPTTDPPTEEELFTWLEGDTPRAYAVCVAYLRGYVMSLDEPMTEPEATTAVTK